MKKIISLLTIGNLNFNLLLLTLLSIFSFYINYYYGFKGVNPLDNFTNYNSGFNFLNDKYPFKNFWTATGPFLGLTQSFFFKIFGINWTSYVIHASFFNSIIAISLFLFLINFGVNNILSSIYSILFSVIFYPPVGTPFVDHHSMMFTYLSFFLIVYSLNEKKNYLFLFLPIFFLFGFFSKQTPIAYFFLLILPIIIYNFKRIRIFYSLFLGSLISLFLFVIYIYFTQTSLIDIYYQYFLGTVEVGDYRLKNSSFSYYDVIFRYRFIYISLILISYLLIKNKDFNNSFKISKFEFIYLLLSLNFTMVFHQLLSMNQAFIYSIIFLNIGLCFKFINYDKKFFNNKIFFLLIIFSIFLTLKYHYKYNEPRRFNDLAYSNKEQNINAGKYFPSLNNLYWYTQHSNNPKEEIENLKLTYQVLKNENKKYSLITDYQFLPIELGIYGNSPVKWFHVNVSFPNIKRTDNKNVQRAFSNFFIKQIKDEGIEKIYFVPPHKTRKDIVIKLTNKRCKIEELNIIENFYEEISINCL